MEIEINRETVEQLIRNIARGLHLERIKRPYSMLSPKPFHFPQFSKLEQDFLATPVRAEGLEIDAIHDHYGMPRGLPQIFATCQGARYGDEFADFSVEMFRLQGDTDQSDELNRLTERTVGNNVRVSNVDPDSLPLGSGGVFSMTDTTTGECKVKILVWRYRVFMDDSSLCLESNWQTNKLTGGGWIPYILGILYANPEKMIADIIRFAPAFKLCNLVEARLLRIGGDTRPKEIQELWSDENCKRFALLVKELAPKWGWIKSNDYDPRFSTPENWVSDVRDRSEFPALFDKYEKLTDDLLLRVTNCNLSSADREPVALACAHAMRELGVTEIYQKHKGSEPAASTLRSYYEKGLRLVKNQQN